MSVNRDEVIAGGIGVPDPLEEGMAVRTAGPDQGVPGLMGSREELQAT